MTEQNNNTAAAIGHHQRLLHLDVLRGLALLGILLVNFPLFFDPILQILHSPPPIAAGFDGMVERAVQVLAHGKFYMLFSMLFGAGFVLMMDKTGASGHANAIYLRRLLVLFGIGLIHAIFIWSGDILAIYAVLGFFLWWLFARTQPGWMIAAAALLMSIPIVLQILFTAGFELLRLDPEAYEEIKLLLVDEHAAMQTQIDSARQVYSEGSYLAAVNQRLVDLGHLYSVSLLLFFMPSILGNFLLGAALMRSGKLREPQQHRRFFRSLMGYGLFLGVLLSAFAVWQLEGAIYYLPTPSLMVASIAMIVGALLLSLGYLALLVTFSQRFLFLAPAGQMALTLYLMQSLCWTWICYGYGLDHGKIPAGLQLVLALVFFALQVVFAHWWLARFRFGPVEWLWRSLTYLQWAPMARGNGL